MDGLDAVLIGTVAQTPHTTMPLVIHVPGAIRGKGRPRFSRRGKFVHVHSDEPTLSAEAWVRHCAVQAVGHPCLEGPLCVSLDIRVGIPASWSKRKRAEAMAGVLRPTGKPDVDNSCKLIFDALNTIVWQDDAQIVDLRVVKSYGEQPGALLQVSLPTLVLP